MHRKITGFHKDQDNNWVAELDCFHQQHVRHKPPFVSRPWTETSEGRNNKRGTSLNCARCDRLEWPEGLVAQRRTPEFNEQTLPKGLRQDHSTKTGTWGKIHVLAGELTYTLQEPKQRRLHLQAGDIGLTPPTMLHHVTPVGKVQLFVEFYSKAC